MNAQTIIVERYRYSGDDVDLSSIADAWSFALDQRAFGRGRLLVAHAERSGRLLDLAHCLMPDPPEAALVPCLDLLGAERASAVVIYTDERVRDESVGPDRALRFFRARALASDLGVHLIDWIVCDRTRFLSLKFALIDGATWWDVT